jgi:glycosyltransferase involved in cell wall biosynthesis
MEIGLPPQNLILPNPPYASVLLATFDMPRHLELVLTGLCRQVEVTETFEVFVCDDGSQEETRSLIRKFQAIAPFPIIHLWQAHQGFRKCRMLNEALRLARGETTIFLDGDCVPHPRFVQDHLDEQEEGYYLAGRRVELGPWISATVTTEDVRAGLFDGPSIRLLQSCIKEDSQYFQRSLRIPNRGFWKLLRGPMKLNEVPDLKGCNFSVARSALETINGFDEAYEGYGREDTDVELRLQNLGLKIKSLKGMALQFHVWHPRREFTPSNDGRLEEVRLTKRVVCQSGIKKIS